MKGKHSCELLDQDRFAAPYDFVQEQGYEYFDMNREYQKAVRACYEKKQFSHCHRTNLIHQKSRYT